MLFVLGNRLLDRAGGTEVHLLTIGEELRRLGHDVVVYSPEVGPFADYLAARGLPVVDRLRDLPADCDVVFAQDQLIVFDLAERYPGAFTVFRICGDVHDFQLPPQVEGVVDLVVVLSERYARAAETCAVTSPVLRLRIPIDVDRLVPLGQIRERPAHAVALGNYGDRLAAVHQACESRGIQVADVGGTEQRFDITEALEEADIVFAKSRAALDAMACGRAVYVYDVFGGDGWVTPELYPTLEADHFAGLATDRIVDVRQIEEDLDDYDARMGEVNRDLVVQHHRARDHVIGLLDTIPERKSRERPAQPHRELSRLVALQWAWVQTANEARGQVSWAHDRHALAEQAAAQAHLAARSAAVASAKALEHAESEHAAAAQHAARVEARLEEITESRAFRLATAYWRWRDRLLRPLQRRPIRDPEDAPE